MLYHKKLLWRINYCTFKYKVFFQCNIVCLSNCILLALIYKCTHFRSCRKPFPYEKFIDFLKKNKDAFIFLRITDRIDMNVNVFH